jgi:hypothetical protein
MKNRYIIKLSDHAREITACDSSDAIRQYIEWFEQAKAEDPDFDNFIIKEVGKINICT